MSLIATSHDSITGWPARSASRAALGSAALLGGAALLVVWSFSLSRSLFDPIGYDQALYQYFAERVIAGDRLYVDVWDQNGPGIVAVHWLSTRLIGSEPVSLRVFDALWQTFTIIALMGLAVRDRRGWATGFLAALLYVLAYYSMGYVHTAQREGFAVLPILLMLHLVTPGRPAETGASARQPGWEAPRFAVAGGLGLFLFIIKPPLGLVFGAVWLHTLLAIRRNGRIGLRDLTPLMWMSIGFIAAGGAAALLLVHLGSWDGFWGVLSRRDMPGYVLGPRLIRDILPGLAAGGIACAAAAAVVGRYCTPTTENPAGRFFLAACFLFGLLLAGRRWNGLQNNMVSFAGLWIPAVGALLVRAWKGRSDTWRLCMLAFMAGLAAVILQGQFFLYHLPPLFALAAWLGAVEIGERFAELRDVMPANPAWAAICMGCVMYLAVGQWWPTMSFVTTRPYVLAGSSLADHYTSITKHKLSCPTYATTLKVAERIGELTDADKPIASLFHEARIHYFSRRPAVYKLIAMQRAYEHMFDEYMAAIREGRPKVIVARVPEALRASDDLHAIEAAVFAEAESFFGPPARTIRELYRAAEIIDDVCLLTLRQST